MNARNIFGMLLLATTMLCAAGCTKPDDENNSGNGGTAETVTVTTYNPISISSNETICGVEVTSDDINYLLEIGVCWSTSKDPTIHDNYKSSKNVDVPFTCTITGLMPGTLYHVRAYALYDSKYYYGDEKTFTTLSNGGGGGIGNVPEGAVNGLFSVSANKQVYFSQGNLQYQASTNTWRFAENQYDWVGGTELHSGDLYGNVYENEIKCDNTRLSSVYSGWIDLFGWGTSGYNHGAVYYQPWSCVTTVSWNEVNACYYAYGEENGNLYDQSGRADWGCNRISNGGGQENLWRTLKYEEWMYLFNTRNTLSGMRYAKATVNGVEGVIILPDSWDSSYCVLNSINGDASYTSNIISASKWESQLENNGAVFLPITGERFYNDDSMEVVFGLDVYNMATNQTSNMGQYWSSDSRSAKKSYTVTFGDDFLACDDCSTKSCGNAVRLVQDYQ